MLTHTYVHPARHRAQLTLADVSLMRGATPVLNHVDLTVTAQSRIAIVGENGRGKSTLLYVLAGVLSPDSGSVQRTGTLGLAEQEMTATDSRTVGQAVAEAMAVPRAAVLAMTEKELQRNMRLRWSLPERSRLGTPNAACRSPSKRSTQKQT